ncbi:MAG: FAD-dependent monooxygenase [Rhodospirillales bacterium]|nr:FAD-dependent monooxygenase [Rhodospirillales bacterium]
MSSLKVDFDIAVIGGGFTGAVISAALAERGRNVLLVEKDSAYRDKNRGELIHSWGVSEAQLLNAVETVVASGGVLLQRWKSGRGVRDLVASTPSGLGCIGIHHPDLQNGLLSRAKSVGVSVVRPARVIAVKNSIPCTVLVDDHRARRKYRVHWVVGADGRNSGVRRWIGHDVRALSRSLRITGALLRCLDLPGNTISAPSNPEQKLAATMIPVGRDRFRAYMISNPTDLRIDAKPSFATFCAGLITSGVPAASLSHARLAGPIGSFSLPDAWVERAAVGRVALVGDAAAVSDPCFGAGLSLALRDVRILSELLGSDESLDNAADIYSLRQFEYRKQLRRLHGWVRHLTFGTGIAADEARRRALPLLAADPCRRPDLIGLGPDAPNDSVAFRRFYGIDEIFRTAEMSLQASAT